MLILCLEVEKSEGCSVFRLNLSVDTAVVLWTQPINFDCVFSSTSEHGFSFGYPPLAICVRPFLNVI